MKREQLASPQPCEVRNIDVKATVTDADFAVSIVSRHMEEQAVNIKAAPIIVAGGYGIGSKEGFQRLFELAHLLGLLVDDVVKVKSMATQETNLNEYLADRGITAHETDLAEMIVQLADDMPSHIVVPAIHRNRSEVRGIFLDRMEDAPEDLSDDPKELTAAARSHLRNKFLHASVAVSGTNMGVAETGTVSIFESEGNGRMCLTLPDTLITLMGIEKLVPRFQDVEIFSQLLPRSATGERMNPYTSMWTGVTEGDGPKEFHLVLMDNGRTKTLADPVGRQALACIRCGSCMNICPVYQHTGGHAYGSVYPGPIGSIITPQLTQGLADDDPVTRDLPDPPARRPQRDDVARAGLVHHLLVELPDPPPPGILRPLGQDDGEHAPVRNRARRRHGQPLRVRPGTEPAGGAVPHQRRLALVGHADGRDVGRIQPRFGQCFGQHGHLRGPDLLAVVLHPARFGEVLVERTLGHRHHLATLVEDDGTRRRGALVQGHDITGLAHRTLLLSV